MKSIEFFRNVPFGQYIDNDTFLHRLSPAVKIVWILMTIVLITGVNSLIILLSLLIITFSLVLLAGIKPNFILRGLLPIFGIVGFVLLLQLLFFKPTNTDIAIASFGKLVVTKNLLITLAGIILRFIDFMIVVTLFTAITTEADTVAGIEYLLKPFSRFSPWVHAFAMTINITFRFVPIVIGELELIVKAQVSRGSPFGERRLFTGPFKAIKDYLPLIIPVILRSLDKAMLLGDAMDARCYRSQGRTRYRALKHSYVENVLLYLGILLPTAVLILSLVLKIA